MRVNTKESIETANDVHDHFGSWKAAKETADFEDGKFVVEYEDSEPLEPCFEKE